MNYVTINFSAHYNNSQRNLSFVLFIILCQNQIYDKQTLSNIIRVTIFNTRDKTGSLHAVSIFHRTSELKMISGK